MKSDADAQERTLQKFKLRRVQCSMFKQRARLLLFAATIMGGFLLHDPRTTLWVLLVQLGRIFAHLPLARFVLNRSALPWRW